MSSEPDVFFAVSPPGLEALVASEVAALGVEPRVTPGGVEFSGDARTLYAANLRLRIASRVLLRIASFRARTFFELERHAKTIPWDRFITPSASVALRVTARKSKLYHEGAIEERLNTSIENRVGSVIRRTVATHEDDVSVNAGQLFIVRFVRDECVVSADASGALLHMRHYRQAVAKAPLRENLAAALLMASRWTGTTSMIDPMCGSGTIAIEAALLARRIAPGLANADHVPRAFMFEQWPEFDAQLWSEVVERARSEILPSLSVAIHGSDRDLGAVTAATSNAVRAGVQHDVAFDRRPVSDANVPDPASWMITNPPYGVRVGTGDQRNLFASLGQLMRHKMPQGRAVFLTPDASVDHHSGLPLQTLFETRNGGIAVRILATPL